MTKDEFIAIAHTLFSKTGGKPFLLIVFDENNGEAQVSSNIGTSEAMLSFAHYTLEGYDPSTVEVLNTTRKN